MRFLLLLLLALPALASKALDITPTNVMHFNVPAATAGWATVGSFKFDFSVNTCTIPGAYAEVYQGFVVIRLQVDGSFEFTGFNNETLATPARAACSQIRVRIRRDIPNALYTIESWNELTGAYTHSSVVMTDTAVKNMSGFNLNLGKTFQPAGPTVQLGAFRFYSSAGALGDPPPNRFLSSGYADLLDYEFENSLADQSGHNLTLVFDTGSASYPTMTALPPVPGLGSIPTTVRAGESASIDANASFSNADNSTLSFRWFGSGPQIPVIRSNTTATPSITLQEFGEYAIKLRLTDADGLVSEAPVAIGAGATDVNGVVVIPDANISRLLGPLIRMNKDPWSWADDRALALAELQIGMIDGSGSGHISPWANVWDVASTNGTISMTYNNRTVTGSGTQFQTDFCGGPGNTVPASTSNTIAIWYNSATYSGTTGRGFYGIDSCDSQTQLTLHFLWGHSTGTQTGINYTVINPVDAGWWTFSNTPGNYYDNVLAFYALYYRTGLTKYRDAARTLAHNFWYGPFYDRGQNYEANAVMGGNFISAGPTRGQSATGLVLWALESGENIWPGIHYLWAWQKYVVHDYPQSLSWITQIGDVRELGYGTAALALCAQYDTDATWRSDCRTALKETINNLWVPLQVTGAGHGNWRNTNPSNGTYMAANGTVYVTVANGSPDIVLHGATWGAGQFGVDSVQWFVTDPTNVATPGNSNSMGESTFYRGTFVDGTRATLERNYVGTSGNKGMISSFLAGFGTQPFMEGIWGGQCGSFIHDALAFYGDTTEANIVKQFSIDSVTWIINNAIDAARRAIYTGVEFLNCSPNGSDPANCAAGEVLNAEVMRNFSVAYLHSGQSATIKTAGDSLYTRMWCKPTGGWTCGTTGYGSYNYAVDDYPTGYQTNPADPLSNKWFGYNFGYGANSGWAAARIGGLASPVLKNITFGCTIPAWAHDVVVGYTRADGTRTSATFTAGPCTLTNAADTRQGSLVTVDFTYRSTDLVTQRRGTGSAIVN